MANIAAAAIGLPTPLVKLDLDGLVVISGGGLVVISCGGLVVISGGGLVVISGSLEVVTGGLVVGGRGGPKGLLVQLEGLRTRQSSKRLSAAWLMPKAVLFASI